jgi:hypothetical protein
VYFESGSERFLGGLFSRKLTLTDWSRLRSSRPAAAARPHAAHQFDVSSHVSVKPVALKSMAAIERCPFSTASTPACDSCGAAPRQAPGAPTLLTPVLLPFFCERSALLISCQFTRKSVSLFLMPKSPALSASGRMA